MRHRRWIIIASAFVLVAAGALFLLQTGPLAQPPPPEEMEPPPPEMDMPEDMMDMPMGGSAGAGGAMEWSTVEAPEEKSITYREFAARTGVPVSVPSAFTEREDGTSKTATFNSWMQLQRVYGGYASGARAADDMEPGRVGGRLTREATEWAGYTVSVAKELAELYTQGLNGFTFKVSHPIMGGMTINDLATQVTDVGPMNVMVVMQVKPSLQRSYGQKVYDRMRKYDCLGFANASGTGMHTTSLPFHVHTYKSGLWRPNKINLSPVAAPVWGTLWAQNRVRLSIKNRAGDEIYSAEQSAGQNQDILSAILNPPEFYYNPKWRLLIPPEDVKFQGGRLNLNGTRCWTYMFSFSLPANVAAQMHSASAELLGVIDPVAEARRLASGAQNIGIGAAGVTTGGGPGMDEFDEMAGPPEDMPGLPAAPPGYNVSGPAMPSAGMM
jgi:hypothetical protein